MRRRTEPAAVPRSLVDAWQRHRFFEGLSRALLAADRPVLLTLDNLHWCDPETLALLSFCLGLTSDAPVLVVATMRQDPDDDRPGLARWLAGMRATGLLTEIDVRPFDPADTAALAASVTGRSWSAPEAAVLQATTGGFPLLIVEAARSRTPRPSPPGTCPRCWPTGSPRSANPPGPWPDWPRRSAAPSAWTC